MLPERNAPVSVSVGVRMHDPAQGGVGFADLYAQADAALYEAKRLGKGRSVFYEPTDAPVEAGASETA